MVPRATWCFSTCRPLIEIRAICLQRVAKDAPELQEVKDRVARMSASCPAYAARDQAGRQGGRRETRSRHRRWASARCCATRTQAQEDARGFGVAYTTNTSRSSATLALSAELTIPDGTSVQELLQLRPRVIAVSRRFCASATSRWLILPRPDRHFRRRRSAFDRPTRVGPVLDRL